MKRFAPILLLAAAASASAQRLPPPAPVQQQTAVNVQTGTVTSGTTLDVQGAISPDGRSLTTVVHAVDGALDGIDTFHSTPGGGIATGGSTLASPLHQPYRPAQFGGIIIVDKDPKLMDIQTPALTLKTTSFKAAIANLSDLTHTNLVLGIRGLQQANIDPTAPHDFTIPAGNMRDTLLAMLDTAAPKSPMVITTDDSVIQICTQAQADNNVITKSYYVEDLLGNLSRFVPSQTDLNTLHDKPPPSTQPAANTSETSLITIISSTVRPEIWKINGGKIGEISMMGNRVIIRAPESVHALLDGPKHFDPNAMPRYITYSP